MTRGVSVIPAHVIVSIIRSNPPPDVATNALVPIYILPSAICTAVISFSACLTSIPVSVAVSPMNLNMDVAGVIGYA